MDLPPALWRQADVTPLAGCDLDGGTDAVRLGAAVDVDGIGAVGSDTGHEASGGADQFGRDAVSEVGTGTMTPGGQTTGCGCNLTAHIGLVENHGATTGPQQFVHPVAEYLDGRHGVIINAPVRTAYALTALWTVAHDAGLDQHPHLDRAAPTFGDQRT